MMLQPYLQLVQHTVYTLTYPSARLYHTQLAVRHCSMTSSRQTRFSNAARSPTQHGSRFDSMSIWTLHWPHPSCGEAKAYISPWCFGFSEEFSECSKATSHTPRRVLCWSRALKKTGWPAESSSMQYLQCEVALERSVNSSAKLKHHGLI